MEIDPIKEEAESFLEICEDLNSDKVDFCLDLIQNASFMAVQLDRLQEEIKRSGFYETIIKNGIAQRTGKPSTALMIYLKMIGSYNSVMRTLGEILTDHGRKEAGSEAVQVDESSTEEA